MASTYMHIVKTIINLQCLFNTYVVIKDISLKLTQLSCGIIVGAMSYANNCSSRLPGRHYLFWCRTIVQLYPCRSYQKDLQIGGVII